MVTTSKIISECLTRNNAFDWERRDFPLLDEQGKDAKKEVLKNSNVDSRNEFTKTSLSKYLSPEAIADLEKDKTLWGLPFCNPGGIFCSVMDLDKWSYYISRNLDWTIKRDAAGNPIYIYHSTWERVDFSKVKNQKEKFLVFFTRDKKRMIIPPRRYAWVKQMCKDFTKYLKDSWWIHTARLKEWDKEYDFSYWLLSNEWINILNRRINSFFEHIESGIEPHWWTKIYHLFDEWWMNQRSFMQTMLWNTFSQLVSDMWFAEKFFWFWWMGRNNFRDYEDFRRFSEAVSTYVAKKSTGNFNMIDAMGNEMASELYWKQVHWLYDTDYQWNVYELKEPIIKTITKEEFSKLSLEQQQKQLEYMWIYNSWKITPFKQKLRIFTHNTFDTILRVINFIGNPSIFSIIMSFGSWLTWLMPLLILNSTMYATEKMSMWTMLDWNWRKFLKQYWLLDDISVPDAWLWTTLTDMSLKWYRVVRDLLQQWVFNGTDMAMQTQMKTRLYQQYFSTYFPGIKSLDELAEKFEIIKDRSNNFVWLIEWYKLWNPEFDQFLQNARDWVDRMMQNANTTSVIRQQNQLTHFTKKTWWQPAQDVFYTLYHFFSWWWFAKLRWARNIIQNALGSPYRDKYYGANFLDKLASGKFVDAPELFRRWYLDNQELSYFLHKVHMAYTIWKYLERMSVDEWEKDPYSIFWDFEGLWEYFKLFNWEVAAFESIPTWRMIEVFLDNYFWQRENWLSVWESVLSASVPTAKEFLRRLFRKTYAIQIGTEYASIINSRWDTDEIHLWDWLVKSAQDNVNGFLFYLSDKTENWEYDYYIPKWPNSLINSFLWVQSREKALVSDQQSLAKYAMVLSSTDAFTNWAIFNLPFFKQWNISQMPDTKWFQADMDKFRATKAYQAFTDNKFPSDMTDDDWLYVYNIISSRAAGKDKINHDTLWTDYSFSFVNDKWEKIEWVKKKRQIQENIVHTLMKNGISEDESKRFSEIMEYYKWEDYSRYVDEAVRTLAYVEAKTPWEGMQVLQYIMGQEWVREVYWDKPEDRTDEQLKKDQEEAKIKIAKKYAKFIPEIDRYYAYKEIILRYAKTHNTSIAPYIYATYDNIEWNTGGNNLIIPWTDKDPNKDPTFVSSYQQNFAAQLMVDVLWAQWNPNAHKLRNWYALIFKSDQYVKEDWSVDPKYATYALNQIEHIYNHITNLALDWDTSRILKQGTLMFGDELFTSILNDKELSERPDVKDALNDWVHYWYKEFSELDQIATDYAEDQLANAEYKKNWTKRTWNKKWSKYANKYDTYNGILNSWFNKKFYWFDDWYSTMKRKAYSNNYMKYRIFDWTPRDYQTDYLKYSEFVKAKNNFAKQQASGKWTSWDSDKNKKWSWQKKDDGVWVTTKRGKSIQFYKMEDIDKPVEYKTPRRKRRVNKWSWTKPMWSTMWKHLTPSQKKK